MIEIVMCRGCHVFNRPEDLRVIRIQTDPSGELLRNHEPLPVVEGPLCKGCHETRLVEIEPPSLVVETRPLPCGLRQAEEASP